MDAHERTTDALVRQRSAWGNRRFRANNFTLKERISVEEAQQICALHFTLCVCLSVLEFSYVENVNIDKLWNSYDLFWLEQRKEAVSFIHLPCFFLFRAAQRLYSLYYRNIAETLNGFGSCFKFKTIV